jgi:hypothetical protein
MQVLILNVVIGPPSWGVRLAEEMRRVRRDLGGSGYPRVFCKKRLDLLDYKGVEFFEKGQEATT